MLSGGDLLEALRQLDEEDDVNKALKYFSYEHFYVIYCKVPLQTPNKSCAPGPNFDYSRAHSNVAVGFLFLAEAGFAWFCNEQ